MIELTASNPAHVAGHSVIDADLGVGGRRLVVISGHAIPDFSTDQTGVPDTDECRVDLQVAAENLEQSSIQVGLSAIGNDDTEYVFATDLARLEINGVGNLALVVHLAVLGEESFLRRFSYQVVLTQRIRVREIYGTIDWDEDEVGFRVGYDVSDIDKILGVMAYERKTRPLEGPFGGEEEVLTAVTSGEIVELHGKSKDDGGDGKWRAVYRISKAPMERDLKIVVTPLSHDAWGVEGFHVGAPDSVGTNPLPPGSEYVRFRLIGTSIDEDVKQANFHLYRSRGPH